MSSKVEFLIQYVKITEEQVDSTPEGATIIPVEFLLNNPGDPDTKDHKFVRYVKLNSGYLKQTIEFPYMKVKGQIFAEMRKGKLVFIDTKEYYSYRCGPTVKCNMIFLMRNGYTIPLLPEQFLKFYEVVNEYSDTGCNLHWETIEGQEDKLLYCPPEFLEVNEKPTVEAEQLKVTI